MKITKNELRKIIKEEKQRLLNESMPRMAQIKNAPMPLTSLASSEFAAAIKGRAINEDATENSAESLKEEISELSDEVQEIRDYCERGNMEFDSDAQTRIATLLTQVLDRMEEVVGVLNDEIASEEQL